jgi:HK97 family phage prohead protease
MEHKQTEPIILNTDDSQGIVEAIWAVMGNVDGGNDVIHPGAFKKTFKDRANLVNLLDNHRTDSVMASLGNVLELREMSKGELPGELLERHPEATGAAWGRFQFLLDTPEGKGAFTRIKQRSIKGWSFGYDTIEHDRGSVEKDGSKVSVRNLRALRLWEVSPVLFPMNEATLTTGVKSAEEETPPEEEKAGRVLSGRNATRIKEAMDALHQCLMEAGLMESMEEASKDGWLCDECYKALGEEYECFTDSPFLTNGCAYCGKKEAKHHLVKLPDNGATGPQKSEEPPTSDAQETGPNQDDSTRYLIELELEKLKLLEV